jgi:hypothetical protein
VEDRDMQRLIATMQCGSCGHRYPPDNVTVLEEEAGLWLLSAVCDACHVGLVVAVAIRDDGPATDLTRAERARFRKIGPVDGDDLLDARDFLERFHGDISGLFPPGPDRS